MFKPYVGHKASPIDLSSFKYPKKGLVEIRSTLKILIKNLLFFLILKLFSKYVGGLPQHIKYPPLFTYELKNKYSFLVKYLWLINKIIFGLGFSLVIESREKVEKFILIFFNKETVLLKSSI